jgi:CspA family cold shock protein
VSQYSPLSLDTDLSDTDVKVAAVVKWFSISKGFGFVAPVDGSPDAFLHISVLTSAGLQTVSSGTELLCLIGSGTKGSQVKQILNVLKEESQINHSDPDDIADHSGNNITGSVKWFNNDKGFGFILVDPSSVDHSNQDVFIHKTVLRRCGVEQLETGQRVVIRVKDASKGYEAVWIERN